MSELTHLDGSGASRMVDVGAKPPTRRMAVASGVVRMAATTRAAACSGAAAKGNVLEVARLAGIMAAKRTADLIPLCHPLPLDAVSVELEPAGDDELRITARIETTARTGVEMEALTAVSVAALTVYDMCKSMDRGVTITDVRLEEKTGGVRGDFRRSAAAGQQKPTPPEPPHS